MSIRKISHQIIGSHKQVIYSKINILRVISEYIIVAKWVHCSTQSIIVPSDIDIILLTLILVLLKYIALLFLALIQQYYSPLA